MGDLGQQPATQSVGEDWFWHERTAWPRLPDMARKQRIVLCDERSDLTPSFSRYADDIDLAVTRDLPQAIHELQHHPAHTLILNAASPQQLVAQVETARQALVLEARLTEREEQ